MKFDLNTIIASYNKLNEQVRYCLLVGVVFLVVLLDVVFLILPQMASISDLHDQMKKLSDDTEQVMINRTHLTTMKKNLEKSRQELSFLDSKIRHIQEVPAILSTISSIANEYGVKISELDPEKSEQKVLTKTPDGNIYTLPVVIKARCGYHKFGFFLNKLEAENLVFLVQDFIIQNDDNDVSSHAYSLTINIILAD